MAIKVNKQKKLDQDIRRNNPNVDRALKKKQKQDRPKKRKIIK